MSKLQTEPVIQVWEDLHEERSGFFRAFLCDSAEATTGCPVVGYCSPGGSYRTIRRVAWEALKMHPGTPVYRNGRRIA